MSDFATPQTIAHQAPLSMEFSRQEYWNGLPCPPPGDLPNPGIEPGSPELQVDSLPAELPEKPWSTVYYYTILLISMSSIETMGKVKFREIKNLPKVTLLISIESGFTGAWSFWFQGPSY